MRLFIKKILRFLLFLVIAYPLLIFLSGQTSVSKALKLNLNYRIGSYGHMFTRLKEVKQLKEKVDVLFLGSSHCYRGFDPRNFADKKTFNLGSSSQTPIQTRILLERYLEKLDPKTIVYEVYPGTLCADGLESSLDLIANDKNDLRSLKMSAEVNNIKTYNTLIYAAIADLFNLNKGFVEPPKRGIDNYISGGYVESELKHFKYEVLPKNNVWNLNIKQLERLRENIDLIKSKNIQIILVFAPITSALYNSYTNNAYVDSIIRSFHVPYYNFNERMRLDDSLDFIDADHMNQVGVNKFNSRLKEVLN